MKKEAWINEGEVGTSSKTIWSVMMGLVEGPRQLNSRYGIPHDPDDFRRCLLLINIAPEWEAEIGKVADVFPAWLPYIREWYKMKKLYIKESPSGKAPRLYSLMQELQEESMLIDGWEKTGPGSWKRK